MKTSRLKIAAAAGATAAIAVTAGAVTPIDNDQSTDTQVASASRQKTQPRDPAERAVSESKTPGAWHRLAVQGDEVEHYEALTELSNATEVVVEGTVVSAEPGRVLEDGSAAEGFRMMQFLELTIKVNDSLGDAEGARYPVEFGPYQPAELEGSWVQTLVGDEGIFVLRRKGSANPETGAPQVDAEFALNKYRLVSSQGLLLNDDGTISTPLYTEPGFPAELDGSDFEETVDDVDELNQ